MPWYGYQMLEKHRVIDEKFTYMYTCGSPHVFKRTASFPVEGLYFQIGDMISLIDPFHKWLSSGLEYKNVYLPRTQVTQKGRAIPCKPFTHAVCCASPSAQAQCLIPFTNQKRCSGLSMRCDSAHAQRHSRFLFEITPEL